MIPIAWASCSGHDALVEVRLFRVLVNGKADDGSTRGRCPRCGGPLERISGSPGDSVLFAASQPGELCEPCLTGHSSGWVPPAPEPDWWFGRLLYGNAMTRWFRDRRAGREAAFVARHEADVLRTKQSGA